MNDTTPDVVEELIERARQGDDVARDALLQRYRDKLNRMVALRLDRRLASRVDPSDVVQETLAVAARKLDEYLRDRPLPFLGWLRHLAERSSFDTHRHHLLSQRRSVQRESRTPEFQDDASMAILVRRLVANDTSPSNRLQAARTDRKGHAGAGGARFGRSRSARDALPRTAWRNGNRRNAGDSRGSRERPASCGRSTVLRRQMENDA